MLSPAFDVAVSVGGSFDVAVSVGGGACVCLRGFVLLSRSACQEPESVFIYHMP